MKQVIKNFVDELTSRVNLLSTMDDNLDSSRVDKVQEIIDKYGVLDTKTYTKKDVNTIGDIIKMPSDNIKDYEAFDKAVKDFIDEYNTIKDTHEDNTSKTTNIYNKYIKLLTSEKLDKLFTKYNELEELMSDMGLSVRDKWQIIEYIDELNIKSREDSIYNINLNSKLVIYTGLYLNNEDLNKQILKQISDISIDVDMIPMLAKKIAGNKQDVTKVQNALTTIIINELYQQLLENKDDQEAVSNLQEMVNLALTYIDSYEDKIIKPAEDLIIKYEDLLNEEIEKGTNIDDYLDITVNDLDKELNDRTKAINLKSLPIIKSIKDTLNNMYKCDKSSDDYIEYLRLLTSLNNAYKEVQES